MQYRFAVVYESLVVPRPQVSHETPVTMAGRGPAAWFIMSGTWTNFHNLYNAKTLQKTILVTQ